MLVAVKTIREEQSSLFRRREIKVLTQAQGHVNIVKLHETSAAGHFIVMEYVDGELFDQICENGRTISPRQSV